MQDLRTPLRAISAVFILNGALVGTWASRIPAVMEYHELTHLTLTGLVLCISLGAMVALPISGGFVDHFGAARFTRFISVFGLLALVLIPLMSTYALAAISLLIFGAVLGGMDVSINAWGAEVERAQPRPWMSFFHAMWSLGAGIGAIGGVLAIKFGLGITIHFCLFALILGSAALFFASAPWISEIKEKQSDSPLFALPTGVLLFVGLLSGCTTLGEGGMIDWSAVFLIDVTGVDQGKAALGFAVYCTAMVMTRLAGDPIVARFGPVTCARASALSAGFGALIAVTTGTFSGAIVGFIFMGIGYSLVMPLAFSRAANDPDVPQGVAIASVATFAYGGALIGPVFIGTIADIFSIRIAFCVLVILAAVALPLTRHLAR